MTYLERDQTRLFYERDGIVSATGSGRGSTGGPVILFTHGFAASSRMFARQIPALLESATTIAWDMRGHGASDYPDDPAEYSTSLVMDDMLELLDVNDVPRAVLVGHSVGGYLSLRFLTLHPDRVCGVVLIGCGPGYRSDVRRREWNDYCERRALAYEREGLAANPDSDEVRIAGHRDATGLAHAARGILTQQDAMVIDELPHIKVPTLALAGRLDVHDGNDFLSPVIYIASKVPGAELTIFELSAHAPCLTQPDAFNVRLGEFLGKLGGRT